MRGLTTIAGAALALTVLTAPAAAQLTITPREEAIAAADAFFEALRSEDRTLLAEVMDPQGTIFIHDHMQADNPRILVVEVADFLQQHVQRSAKVDEHMIYKNVLVSGDMAQVWGPYAFRVDGEITHCGVNSLSLIKRGGQWKVANTSFTMEKPALCPVIGAPMLREGTGQ